MFFFFQGPGSVLLKSRVRSLNVSLELAGKNVRNGKLVFHYS